MEVHFTPELEDKLTHSAASQGRDAEELVRDVVTRYFEEEARFVEAIHRGEQALRVEQSAKPLARTCVNA